ncbi:MAG: HPP family protein [Sphingobium sp.]
MDKGVEGWIFRPRLAGATGLQRLIACGGAALAIMLSYLACKAAALGPAGLPILAASVGASAVLLFVVPSSPLAQPWPVIGGTSLSAMIGIAVGDMVPEPALAGGIAVGLAILVMSLLRCLHPPGGGAALGMAVIAPAFPDAGYAVVIAPFGINSVAIVLCAMAYHRFTRHSYPHRPGVPASAAPAAPVAASGLHIEDIDKALVDLGETFDISRADLDLLLNHAELHAKARCARS